MNIYQTAGKGGKRSMSKPMVLDATSSAAVDGGRVIFALADKDKARYAVGMSAREYLGPLRELPVWKTGGLEGKEQSELYRLLCKLLGWNTAE